MGPKMCGNSVGLSGAAVSPTGAGASYLFVSAIKRASERVRAGEGERESKRDRKSR